MAKPKGGPGFGCSSAPGGQVNIFFTQNNKPGAGICVPGKDIGAVVALLLAVATDTAKKAGQSPRVSGNTSLAGTPMLIPTTIGLSEGEPPEPVGFVIHAGMARFGIALTNPRELGQALIAASATRDTTH